ncbi:MAG TPA: hypothetical protein VFF60_08670 [Candidatus Binatus sp.]|nr:hypothetical protein [Candidatus Binatus sp.]
MHKLSIVIAAAAIAVGGYPVLADQSMPAAVTVPIAAQNGSGQTGVATLTATSDNKTKVDISMNGEPSGANEPAHIHPGPCKTLNPAPKYPLNPIVNGKSSTVVDVPISSLQTGAMAINVHESSAAIQNYVACGNIASAANTAPAAPSGNQPMPAPSSTY